MTASITALPIWKNNAPAHERLYELAELAREKPEYFKKWAIVYCEDNEQQFKARTMQGEGTRTSDALACLTAGIQHILEETRR